jgi:hypothetical protein
MENKKPIRQQLCQKCLKKYRLFENARRQRIRLKIKEKVSQVSGKVPTKKL